MHLDPNSGIPLYLQLVVGLTQRIASGDLAPGAEIPSSRDLATELRVNYHTIARAYRELEQDGLLERQRGGAYLVARRAAKRAASAVIEEAVSELCERAKVLGLDRDEVLELVALHLDKANPRRKLA